MKGLKDTYIISSVKLILFFRNVTINEFCLGRKFFVGSFIICFSEKGKLKKYYINSNYKLVSFEGLIFPRSSPFNDQCFHHIETIQLICTANQLTGFYMMGKLTLEVKIIFPFACSKSTEETPEKCVKRHSRVFIFNFEQISCIVLVTQ